MPDKRHKKQIRFTWQSPVVWLFLAILICANLATFFVLWILLSNPGAVSGRNSLANASSFLLPKPTPAVKPTATATRVAVYLPTATVSPTPSPSPLPTATATTPPPAIIAPLPTAAPAPEIKHVIIISIDGLRPDALFLAHTPTLDTLIERGAYSDNAQTISLSITLPGHASMLSGMLPEKHGIKFGLPYIGWPGMNGPTLFTVAHDAGLSTGMIFGKDKLSYIALPNSVDILFGENVHDAEIRDQAIKTMAQALPAALFIHFPDTDRVGHEYGWMSENQLQSINYVDGLIGEIVTLLEQQGEFNSTLLIVSADHGGHGLGHGDDSPEDRTIPWLAVGPGVTPGVKLASHINTFDTAATAAYALKLPIPEVWDGQPALEIFGPVAGE